jgi:hypothetical protein
MTYLEAIRGKLNYPLSENAFKVALEDRGLYSEDIYVKCESFDLAYADLIVTLLTAPNISEGGFTINLADRKTLLNIADKIYTKYDEASPIDSLKPKATFIQRF